MAAQVVRQPDNALSLLRLHAIALKGQHKILPKIMAAPITKMKKNAIFRVLS